MSWGFCKPFLISFELFLRWDRSLSDDIAFRFNTEVFGFGWVWLLIKGFI